MNKAKLKSYAPQARKDFIAAVTARANLLGLSERAGRLDVAPSQPQGDVTMIAGQAWPIKVHSQRQQLIIRIQKDGFAQTMEAVAYTWFNRFAALRYMELHDYLGHGHRALSSLEGTLPDILTHAADLAQSGAGEGGLPGLKPALVVEMKLAGNRDGELYRLLLVAQCNSLSNSMPFLFERIDDETELLLPDNLLRTDSVIAKLVTVIDEEDWKEVEIIGWLYQFYISEKKEEVSGTVVKSEDIPAATQLFTPNWIVQYLVQNSIGRLWLMANPTSTLNVQWPYYIAPADQTLEVQAQLDTLVQTRMNEDGGSLNPESITLLDPACGSGHILVEAYEVLKAIYLERGYQPRAIPRLILEKNLYGLDIDDRAAQMAGFALMMKARADDRHLFNEPVKLNVLALQTSNGLDAYELTRALNAVVDGMSEQVAVGSPVRRIADDDIFSKTLPHGLPDSVEAHANGGDSHQVIAALITIFAQAKALGSLIHIPPTLNSKLAVFGERLQWALLHGDLYARGAARDLWPLVAQAKLLGMQFDAVAANPPYMGARSFNPILKEYLRRNYDGFEKDLFSAFIAKGFLLTKKSGFVSIMTSFVWMFITSFERLRRAVVEERAISSLVQLEYDAFEDAKAHICAFVSLNEMLPGYTGSFIRLADFKGSENQGPKTLEAIRNPNCGWFFETKIDEFRKMPGLPIAYWIKGFDLFLGDSLRTYFVSGGRNKTHDNDLYLRFWWEVNQNSEIWLSYANGGDFRRHYGNEEWVINWSLDARNYYASHGGLSNEVFWGKAGITWSLITSAISGFRIKKSESQYSSGSPVIFSKNEDFDFKAMAFLNSNVAQYFLKAINPTINTTVNDVLSLPYNKNLLPEALVVNAKENLNIAKLDWNSRELSVDFVRLPLIESPKVSGSLAAAYSCFEQLSKNSFANLRNLETENNRIIINAYGLQGEISPEIPESQITLARADREKDCQRLMSYAIGCIMGRYSLDEPGLIYANSGNVSFDITRYVSFTPDTDGIVPLTDLLWFEDEAASRVREFLLAVWGADTLAENMAWLAKSLGVKTGETPDETIRRYLADKFYKDHLQTYKKRPIYWLFSSGKQGAFQALVYLHRYHEGTLARMRAEYVVPLTGKIQSRIDMLEKDATAAASTAARNKLSKEVEKLKKKHVELLAYDEKLRHYADMRIALDLDDGVKVNYGKFGDLLAEVKVVTGGGSDD